MGTTVVESALDERTARMALCALRPAGNLELGRLVTAEGAALVWETIQSMGEQSRWGRAAANINPEELHETTQTRGYRFLIPGDPEWPTNLDDLDAAGDQGAPLGLWARGPQRLDELAGAVAIVGARAATGYGLHVATDWASEITAAGRVVISGMAFGIDAAAHRGALLNRGVTVAVLASGLDLAYPVANTTLMENIAQTGALVSELPPGTHPTKDTFLARNRIIAALAAGAVIIEAAARSGARNTMVWSNTLGRATMAVPGAITSSMSATPNRLIHDQEADMVTTATEVLTLTQPN